MKKYFFVLLILASTQVFSMENSCCEGLTSDECVKIPKNFYDGMIEGYVEQMEKYQKEEGRSVDRSKLIQEAKKMMLSEDEVYKLFEKCGQEDAAQNCQKCFMDGVMKGSIHRAVDHII